MFKFNGYIKERIMSLELLNKRLSYAGGNQQQRMIQGKQKSLKKALLYSYQSNTAELEDGREFRCLINPDQDKPDYDNKIISILFKDICLNKRRLGTTSQGEQEIGLKPGDVFLWKETNTHWLVFLQRLSEKAYFRSEIRRCDSEVTINNKSYWVYTRGPQMEDINWLQQSKYVWNDLNYKLILFITADENTNNFFSRFTFMRIKDPRDNKEKTWQINAVNPYYGDGIIQVYVKEYFQNEIEYAAKLEKQQQEKNNENPVNESQAHIEGPIKISQYSKNNYIIKNAQNGKWFVRKNDKELDLHCESNTLVLENFSRDKGLFTLIYRIQGQQDIILDVTIVPI